MNQLFQMKYLKGQCYVEVKDRRYRIHPTGNIILGLRDEPKSLRTQYQIRIIVRSGRVKKLLKAMEIYKMRIIIKINNQLFNNVNINLQIVPIVKEIIG